MLENTDRATHFSMGKKFIKIAKTGKYTKTKCSWNDEYMPYDFITKKKVFYWNASLTN